MSSPNNRKSAGFNSPKKSMRPSTAVLSPKKSSMVMNQSQWSQMQIIQELNGQEIKSQDKDIEIERLQTQQRRALGWHERSTYEVLEREERYSSTTEKR